jgi:hypothetical protein
MVVDALANEIELGADDEDDDEYVPD